jgi:hypothetical protein
MCSYSHSWDGSRSSSTREPIFVACSVQNLRSLFSTTYMGQVMAHELGEEPDRDIATRTGEFAMLIYSIGMFLWR